jgi:hypothetical protein
LIEVLNDFSVGRVAILVLQRKPISLEFALVLRLNNFLPERLKINLFLLYEFLTHGVIKRLTTVTIASLNSPVLKVVSFNVFINVLYTEKMVSVRKYLLNRTNKRLFLIR